MEGIIFHVPFEGTPHLSLPMCIASSGSLALRLLSGAAIGSTSRTVEGGRGKHCSGCFFSYSLLSVSTVPSTTLVPLRYVSWLSPGSSNTITSFPYPCRPKGGQRFLLPSPPLWVPSTLPTPLQIVPSLNCLQKPSCDAPCFLLGAWLLESW